MIVSKKFFINPILSRGQKPLLSVKDHRAMLRGLSPSVANPSLRFASCRATSGSECPRKPKRKLRACLMLGILPAQRYAALRLRTSMTFSMAVISLVLSRNFNSMKQSNIVIHAAACPRNTSIFLSPINSYCFFK